MSKIIRDTISATRTKQDELFIDADTNPLRILVRAQFDNLIKKYDEDIHFCIYNTKIDNCDGLILVFSLKLKKANNSAERIMELIKAIESMLLPNISMKYLNNVNNDNISILVVTKKTIDDDNIQI